MNSVARSLLTVVGIPGLVAGLYFFLIASDVYVSEASFAIRSAQAGSSPSGLSALLASPIAATGSQDSMLVAEYIHSHDMIHSLQEELDIRGHYSHSHIDRLSRLDEDATDEQLRDYFRKQISVRYDPQSDVLSLKVRSFDAQLSHRMASAITRLSEALINDISDRMEADALSTAQTELERAMHKVNQANAALSDFRGSHASMDPIAESQAQFTVVSALEQRISEVQAELSEKRAFMRDDSAQVVSLMNRHDALARQLLLEKDKLVGGADARSSHLIASYQPLELEQQLAQQQYASALTSLEMARLEAQRKKLYLVTFIAPSLPDEAIEPKRLLNTLTVMIFSFLLFVIGGLMWSALQDHIGK